MCLCSYIIAGLIVLGNIGRLRVEPNMGILFVSLFLGQSWFYGF